MKTLISTTLAILFILIKGLLNDLTTMKSLSTSFGYSAGVLFIATMIFGLMDWNDMITKDNEKKK